MKVAIINGSSQYTRLFTQVLGMTEVAFDRDERYPPDLVVFTGGEDVTPALYGDAAHKFTGNSPYRDEQEKAVFNYCVDHDIPMVGICRGAQFLNVMSGGRMYQHVSGHLGNHEIVDMDSGDTIVVSSTHHQMMMPSGKAIIKAISTLGGTREWYDGQVFKRDVSNTDYEVVFYPETRCLCFQPHPEFPGEHYAGMRDYFTHLVNELLVAETA